MIRVGFVVASSSLEWFGGVSYLRNLFLAINTLPDRSLKIVIITNKDTSNDLLDLLPADEIIRTDLVRSRGFLWKFRRFLQIYIGRDYIFENFLKSNDIQILSHSGHLGYRCPLPAISWIPDFQELSYPEFFSEKELRIRLKNRRELLKHSSCVILSSYAAKQDLVKVEDIQNKKIEILHFVADVPNYDEINCRDKIISKYGIYNKYFIVPNQFWLHKNHVIVIEALNILKKNGIKIQVVATGNTHDHRHPDHFKNILDLLKLYNVEDEFRILGSIPYTDLITLIHESIGLINPSLFEGWSNSVEEAKSLGKTVLLSNIPVHIEQAPSNAYYFDPNNSDHLAKILLELWSNSNSESNTTSDDNLRQQLLIRRLEFAKKYRDIISQLLDHKLF